MLKQYFIESIEKGNDQFANGRFVRNVFDDLVMNQARRIINIEKPNISDLQIIVDSDINFI